MLQGWDDTPAEEPWANGSSAKDAWRTPENVGEPDAWRGEVHPGGESWRGEPEALEAPVEVREERPVRRVELHGRIWKRVPGERKLGE
jgi:hypothetical protein